MTTPIGSVGRALGLLALLASTAGAAQIHCGGVDCANLRIRCTGPDPCHVGIVGEGINGPFDVAVTRRHDGQDTTEAIVLDRLVNVSIRTGSGDDGINFDDSHFDGKLRISTGRGDDGISMQDWGVRGRARIETGPGNDQIFSDGAGFDGPLLVLTGDGDDFVEMAILGADAKLFDGGTGDDTLKVTVDPATPPSTIKRFETVEPY